jgi:MoaA/NifB/PqqE/SkfB family radical SAM enzyme
MKIQTFSVVVGGNACNAKCQYCVSKLTGSENGLVNGQKPMEINRRNFNIGCNFAKMSGVSTVLLTGKGEPLLYRNHISRYLEMLEKHNFPFIELQTNGILLARNDGVLARIEDEELIDWYNMGLTTISLSCAGYDSVFNKNIFGKDIHLGENIDRLHRIGFSVRVSCVGVKGMVDTIDEVIKMAKWCKARKVEQFTWRPATNISLEEVEGDAVKRDVYEWIKVFEVNHGNLIEIWKYFENPENATLLLELAHGAKVYDIDGQNISINSCLTDSPNPDDIRQLIFSSDGHLRYSWTKEGAIII